MSKATRDQDRINVMSLYDTGNWSTLGISNACGLTERYVRILIKEAKNE